MSPSKVAVNTEFLDIFQISVAVRMRLKSSNQLRQTAILIRDPQRQLLRRRGGGGGAQQGAAALGAEAAQERILQASQAAAWGSDAPVTHLHLSCPQNCQFASATAIPHCISLPSICLCRPRTHTPQVAGWHVVCLDSQTVLQLPAHILSEELGALMLEDSSRSSLRFVA